MLDTMTSATNDYKTPFEKILEIGLYAYDLSLALKSEEGSILLDEFFPILTGNSNPLYGQFIELHSRFIQGDGYRLEHILATQRDNSTDKLPTVNEARERRELYEVLSLWIPPGMLTLPHFELTAQVDQWYVNSQDRDKHKQPYNPREMTLQTLHALQGRLHLPPGRIAPVIEID